METKNAETSRPGEREDGVAKGSQPTSWVKTVESQPTQVTLNGWYLNTSSTFDVPQNRHHKGMMSTFDRDPPTT